MSTNSPSKINTLLKLQPNGVVMLSAWLSEKGYSLDLLQRYKKSRWLKSIGTGAVIKVGDKVDYMGAIYALQNQANMTIHPSGKTALSLLGKAHYLELATAKIFLFGAVKEKLPLWFRKYDWGIKLHYHATEFLPPRLGLTDLELQNYTIRVSSPARAIMECLHLTPKEHSVIECYELMENLNNLRPNIVQELLEECNSVKVKRLFLYLAEKANHQWFQYLRPEKIDLGKGKRSIVKNGCYVAKYQITVPKELEDENKPSL